MAIPIPRPAVTDAERPHFFKHVCPPTFGGGPLDAVPGEPHVFIQRELLRNFNLVTMEGDNLPMWVIEDPLAVAPAPKLSFPSPLVRLNEGDLLYAHVGGHGNTHTIHWHGIEPSPYNDGVGKHSFEISGNFIYRWLAAEAGTYFYHCHKNTPLHFEMGLYGLLIIDPPGTNPAVFPRQLWTGGPAYDVEAFWVSDDIDSVWHRTLGHDAFMMGCDANDPMNPNKFTRGGILNQFRPTHYGLTGVMQRKGSTAVITDPRVAITAIQGQRILIRVLNAAYDVARFTIGAANDGLPALNAQVNAMDGRPLASPNGAQNRPTTQYASPFTITKGTPFNLSTARRWDLLITAPQVPRRARGGRITYTAQVEFFDYLTGVKNHTARTTITVRRP